MANPSPFAGAKLTDQTPLKTDSRDQRLFSSVPVQAPPPKKEKKKEETQEVGKEGSREVGKETSLPGKRESKRTFDINEKPYRKDSFLFTAEEFEALEDLKLEIRRKFDLKTTKNDIARCALQHLIEDYRKHGADSVVIKRLTKKTG